MFLSGSSIKRYATDTSKPLFEEESFCEKLLQQASYDLRLGREYFVVGSDVPLVLDEEHPYLVLRPGQFAFLSTFEKLHLPFNLLGLITLRNRYKRQGLVNISGFHVDPTFRGNLVFAVQNVGPADLRLKYKEAVFTIFFVCTDAKNTDEQHGVRPSSFEGLSLDVVQNLGGSTVTLARLQKEIQDLKTLLLLYAPFVLAALVPLIIEIVERWRGKH